jgi:hypothetical protein
MWLTGEREGYAVADWDKRKKNQAKGSQSTAAGCHLEFRFLDHSSAAYSIVSFTCERIEFRLHISKLKTVGA